MIILAIETSCDDTCIALIKVVGKKQPCFKILSNIVSSQIKIHKKFGGVYPTMAKREHQRNLVPVLRKSLLKAKLLKLKTSTINNADKKQLKKILKRESELFKKILNFFEKYQKPQIDVIAVTIGPGLEPCLWVGVNFAKALSFFWKKPLVPVNHIEGHIFANFLPKISSKSKRVLQEVTLDDSKNQNAKCNLKIKKEKIEFPAICLIVSGGHTQLILMNSIRSQRNLAKAQKKQTNRAKDFSKYKYKIIGETRDDAAGECFDKTARILGLGYPGGPAIAEHSCKDSTLAKSIKLPRPMFYAKNYDFSFSGLKTAVLYEIKDSSCKIKDKKYVQAMCAEIQQAIIDVLIHKTLKAAKDYQVKTIILGGGVVANKELRKQFLQKIKKEKLNFKLQIPSFKLCIDNAAMIGIAGYYCYLKHKLKNWSKIIAKANLKLK